MSENPPPNGGNGDAGRRVSFDYLKSPHFRVIRADGVIGSITPNRHIHFALYSERPSIPRHVVHEITPEGKLGREIGNETVSLGGFVREMEVDVFLTIETAKSLKSWLEEKINQASARTAPSSKKDD